MSNFKVGEKVVCIESFFSEQDIIFKNDPKINETVTIQEIESTKGYLVLSEYLFDLKGTVQCFNPKKFRKLDRQFAEDICAELVKQVKEEQLILS